MLEIGDWGPGTGVGRREIYVGILEEGRGGGEGGEEGGRGGRGRNNS